MSGPAPRGPRNATRTRWRMPTKARWYPLYVEDEEFKLWFDNQARGNPSTAVENARVLYRYLKIKDKSLSKLTDEIKADRDRFEKHLVGFVGELEEKGYAPGYIDNYLKALRSWANWQGVKLVRKIKVSNRNHTPTLEDEQVPTIQQIKDFRSSASLRGRICVGAVAYGGLRPEVLGHQRYEDGLKLGDLPELNLKRLEFTKIPAQVVVRPELSKAGHTFRTFLPMETCRDILAYLERRRADGENLEPSSPLVAVSSSHRSKGQRAAQGRRSGHIVTAIVSRDIRRAMRPTYTHRPFVLRSFFSTRLLLAVSDGLLENNYRIYWMGHKGQMSARYSSNKALLPDDLIESMREAYSRSLPFLMGTSLKVEELRRKMLIDSARMFGFDDEVLDSIKGILDGAGSVDEAIQEISQSGIVIKRTGEAQRKLRDELGSNDKSSEHYLIVNGDEALLDHVKDGWVLVKELSPEAHKGDLSDEDWVTPNGVVVSSRDKVYFAVQGDSVEMRGDPKVLDDIIGNLEDSGVLLRSIDPVSRYLLRKRK